MTRMTFASARACLAVIILGATSACTGPEGGMPYTFSATLGVEPKGRSTEDLYKALLKVGARFGLKSSGYGYRDQESWQVMDACGAQHVSLTLSLKGSNSVHFGVFSYGFKSKSDYEEYIADLLALASRYGEISHRVDNPPLPQKTLEEFAAAGHLNVTDKCAKVQ